MKKIKHIIGIVILLVFIGCDTLDKENLGALRNDDMWGNAAVATAYVNDIYGMFMPREFRTERNTEETMVVNGDYTAVLSDYLQGTITENSYNYFPYDGIRLINIFLDGIDQATFDEATKKSLKAQAQFWRAWVYFRMVRAYGGVPLALTALSPNAPDEEIFLPRSKTSECFAQILKDIDEATPNLIDKSSDGHIDKCVAMSFKGIVLMFYASPQFNRNNDINRWEAAYNANKAAIDFLNEQGKGLYPDYGEIWHDEMNKEVIMVKRFQYPSYSNTDQHCLRPLIYSRGCVGGNLPSLELVNSFLMKDGSKYDPSTMDYRTLYQNRDDRFYATVAYNGAPPFIQPMFGNENMWIYWYDADGDPSTGINGNEARSDNQTPFSTSGENLYSHSSFYNAKMVDRTVTRQNAQTESQVDWIEIRYAEVLMNLAECANEIGETNEALSYLYQIRDRAGIIPGADGKYGITATSIAQIREVIQDEKLIEFTFEQKRFWDLRRWRIYAKTFNNFEDKYFHGLRYDYNGSASTRPAGLTDIDDVYDQFEVSVIRDTRQINMLEEDKYSFFGIPVSVIERNSKIEQNNTWGGTFDPLL